MYPVSTYFNEACAGPERGIAVKACVNDSIWIDGGQIIEMAVHENLSSSDGITIGSAYASELEINLIVSNDILPLMNAKIAPYVGVAVSDLSNVSDLDGGTFSPWNESSEISGGVFLPWTDDAAYGGEFAAWGGVEYAPLGAFYVTEIPSKTGYRIVKIKAFDKMGQLDKSYEPRSGMEFPAAPADIVADIAAQYSFSVAEEYEYPDIALPLIECTAREMLGYIAGLLGANAQFDRNGELRFIWYRDNNVVQITRASQWDGGLEMEELLPRTIGAITTGTEDTQITIGSGETLSFENPYITKDIAQAVYEKVNGTNYTPASIKWRGDPSVTSGDIVAVESNAGEYITLCIMAQVIKVSGGMNITSYCYANKKNDDISLSPTERRISAVMKSLESAIADASALLNGTMGGIFRVTDSDGDGINDGCLWTESAAADFHGKCLVANHEGIGLSQDGGKTYTQAITHNGINASAITVGQMNAERIAVYGDDPMTDFFKVEPFTDSDGVEKVSVVISAGDSEIILRQVNNKIGFFDRSGKALMYMTNSTFDLENLERFRIGDCKITKRASGNHTFDFS